MRGTIVRVGDLAEQVRGVSYSKHEAAREPLPGYVPILRAGNITDDGLTFDDLVFVPQERVTAKQRLRRGDVLIATSSGSLDVVGKGAAVMEDVDVGFGAFCKVLRPNGRVHHPYFAHFFKTMDYRQRVRALAAGANINNLRNEHLDELEIPLPPIDEQRRIAEILDRAQTLRAKRHRVLVLLEDLTESMFFAHFGHHHQTPIEVGDRLEEHPYGWRWELLTDVARLATGHTPDRKRPDFWGGDIPWVTLSDIRRLDGSVAAATSEMITQSGIDNSSAVKLPAGTVCFSRTASVGFVTVMGREMATSQDFVNWVCGPTLEPIYLMHAFLRSRQRLRALSTGSTHKTIYFPTVERFRALIPPLSLQHEFAKRVAMIEKVKQVHLIAQRHQEDLFASLQHRAFRGDL